jgi:hypothetical protein
MPLWSFALSSIVPPDGAGLGVVRGITNGERALAGQTLITEIPRRSQTVIDHSV